jgi:hypothetical protein
MERIGIVTYSQNSQLYEMASRLLDLPLPKVKLYDWEGATYVQKSLTLDFEWIVLVDEDSFTIRPESIVELVDHMESRKYALCGVPDGGVISIRNHNPIACNPFLLILHRPTFTALLDMDPDVGDCAWNEAYEKLAPAHLFKAGVGYVYDALEPYYPFFFWAAKHRVPTLYLDAEVWAEEPEQISTLLLDHLGRPFIVHTWYSREFSVGSISARRFLRHPFREVLRIIRSRGPSSHRERILRAYNRVVSLKQDSSALNQAKNQ